MFGVTGCFAGPVGSGLLKTAVVESGDCGDVALSRISWGNILLRNSFTFERAMIPGAPGDQGVGDPLVLALAGGATRTTSLGSFSFVDYVADGFSRTYLNLSFWFTPDALGAPSFSFNDQLLLSLDLEGQNEWVFTPPYGSMFTVGGLTYEFSIAGFDQGGDCSRGVYTSRVAATNPAALCGSFRYVGDATVVPEPSSLSLTALVLGGVLLIGQSRRRRSALVV